MLKAIGINLTDEHQQTEKEGLGVPDVNVDQGRTLVGQATPEVGLQVGDVVVEAAISADSVVVVVLVDGLDLLVEHLPVLALGQLAAVGDFKLVDHGQCTVGVDRGLLVPLDDVPVGLGHPLPGGVNLSPFEDGLSEGPVGGRAEEPLTIPQGRAEAIAFRHVADGVGLLAVVAGLDLDAPDVTSAVLISL